MMIGRVQPVQGGADPGLIRPAQRGNGGLTQAITCQRLCVKRQYRGGRFTGVQQPFAEHRPDPPGRGQRQPRPERAGFIHATQQASGRASARSAPDV